MKKIIIISVLMLIFKAYSQEINKIEKGLLKLNILMPSLEYELGISKKSTLNFGIGTVLLNENRPFSENKVGVLPKIEFDYRFYYNLDRRLNKEKRTENNSGNYFGLKTSYTLGSKSIGRFKYNHNHLLGGVAYGMQRAYNSGLYFNLEGGLALKRYDVYDGKSVHGGLDTAILINAKFGWMFSKKRK